MIDRNRRHADLADHDLFSRHDGAVVNRRLSGEGRRQRGEVGPDDPIEKIVGQQHHHFFCRINRQWSDVLTEAVMNEMRQIADVIGVRVGDVDGLDARLL